MGISITPKGNGLVSDGAIVVSATSVSVPTPTAVDHAVKVVAWDAATGRYAVQGPNGVLEQGDTGWITPTLINGWVGTDFQIRRVGDWVQFRGQLDGNASTNTNFLVVSSGFLPGDAEMGVPVTHSARSEGFGMLYGSSSNGSNLNIQSLGSTTDIYRMNGAAYMPVNSTWPTVLPT
jgi:hypothetical protein